MEEKEDDKRRQMRRAQTDDFVTLSPATRPRTETVLSRHLEEEHCTVGLTCYRTPTIHDDMTIYRREIARI